MNTTFEKIFAGWSQAVDQGISGSDIPYAVYLIVMNRMPPDDVRRATTPIELCNFIQIEVSGVSLTETERRLIADDAVQVNIDIKWANRYNNFICRPIRIIFILSVFVAAWRNFSWLLLAITIVAMGLDGFGKTLARHGKSVGKLPFFLLLFEIATVIVSWLQILGKIDLP